MLPAALFDQRQLAEVLGAAEPAAPCRPRAGCTGRPGCALGPCGRHRSGRGARARLSRSVPRRRAIGAGSGSPRGPTPLFPFFHEGFEPGAIPMMDRAWVMEAFPEGKGRVHVSQRGRLARGPAACPTGQRLLSRGRLAASARRGGGRHISSRYGSWRSCWWWWWWWQWWWRPPFCRKPLREAWYQFKPM